jgi:hypothetical protein
MIGNIFTTETSSKKQRSPAGQTTPPNEDITYNDEAAPWGRRNHLMGTSSLPPSDDSNNFSGTLL